MQTRGADIDQVQNLTVGVDVTGDTVVTFATSARPTMREVQTIRTSAAVVFEEQTLDLRTFAASTGAVAPAIGEVQALAANRTASASIVRQLLIDDLGFPDRKSVV